MPSAVQSHAQSVLEKRFLLRDERGVLVEDADGLFRRVARAVATIDERYGDHRAAESEETFYDLMSSLRFLPNSPTLMNAGTPDGQLSGCFVLPIDDSMSSIYGALRDAALIQKSGGGTGFSFSRLRPEGDYVRTTRGTSSGPLSFMRLFDYSTQVNRLGGTRAGANMAVLRHDHPDIAAFVGAKRDPQSLTSFNLSVMVTGDFMASVEHGDAVPLRFPPTDASAPRGRIDARALFDAIVANAWATGDPGLLFHDAINASNPTPHLGAIEATNPCGEQPLLPYESCNLGSINVSRFVRSGAVDYDALRSVVRHAVHFLDNVLDANVYPVPALRSAALRNRKIGLGVMGFADLLVDLGISYASPAALAVAETLMRFVDAEAKAASEQLAATRGPFPEFAGSRLAAVAAAPRRHACVTTIAPTGTISLLADCSSGIEPYFALSYRREVIGETAMVDVNPRLEPVLRGAVADPAAVLRGVRLTGRLGDRAVPAAVRERFATAHEISPEWHVRMQAAFQAFTDTSVSKTINLPNSAAEADVAAAYVLAFRSGCKGVTVFRDGCKANQVLRPGVDAEHCPDCGSPLAMQSGCQTCVSCGYSLCAV